LYVYSLGVAVVQHIVFLLFLTANVLGEARKGVVDAHAASKIPLRVFNVLQLVDAQLEDAFAKLAQSELRRNHRHFGTVASVGGRGVRWPKDVHVVVLGILLGRCW
jgi:hypothetical protein